MSKRSLTVPSAVSSLFVLLLGSGCATTLSSFQTAEPVERGHVQAVTGAGFYTPLGKSVDVIDVGKDQAEKLGRVLLENGEYTFSEQERKDLLNAAIALAILPPAPSYEVAVRTGLGKEDWDVGLRYSINALRVDTKYRVFHRDNLAQQAAAAPPGASTTATASRPMDPRRANSFDVAVGFGVSKYLFSNPVFDVLDFAKLAEFNRWDFEIPVYLSYRVGEVFKVYGGPRYLYSRVRIETNLVRVSEEVQSQTGVDPGIDLSVPSLVNMHFYGATAGIAFGFRHVHAMLELTGGYTYCQPLLLGEKRNIGGGTLYPAAGLAFSF